MTAGQSRKIWLTRHGESEYNRLGKIGGDSMITERGETYAQLLPEVLDTRLPAVSERNGGGGGARVCTAGAGCLQDGWGRGGGN